MPYIVRNTTNINHNIMNSNILYIIPIFMFLIYILGNILKYFTKKYLRHNRDDNIQPHEELGELEIVPQRNRQFTIKNMTVYIKNDEHDTICSICIDKFNINDEICKLGCEHEYHLKCIEPWIVVNISNNVELTCPNCREGLELEYMS